MALVIQTNGATQEVQPQRKHFTLQELQGLVGGYIEFIHLTDGRWLVVDEDGKPKRLPVNIHATAMAGLPGDSIVERLSSSRQQTTRESADPPYSSRGRCHFNQGVSSMDNYPPGPMTGRGGPFDDGCPCAGCPALTFGTCDCDLEEVDDEGLGGLPDLHCNLCGCCREHCQCYDDEAALEVEQGDLLDALDPDRESGLEWDAGADLTPTRQPPVHRAGQNYWVTHDLAHPWPGEEGLYFEEQRWADQTPPMTCPHGHVADFKPTVGTHVCQECGMIYIRTTDRWINSRPARHTHGEED